MKRSYEKEMMDLSGHPRELLEEDLANLRVFNRYLGGHRSVMRGLSRLVREQRLVGFSLLDVGTGSGDVPARITEWAQQRGIETSIVALEPEAVTAGVAAAHTNPPVIPFSKEDFGCRRISVVRADGLMPPFRPASFDFVLASQLLHHFTEDRIVALLRTWSQLARRAIIVSDLVRHPVAYHGIGLITKICTRNVMTRTDAPLSVRRAFTRAEWSELFRRAQVGRFQIFPVFPYRMLALISPEGSA